MADVVTNLKVKFGADNKQFKKGADESNKALSKFSEDGKKSFSSLAGLIDSQTGGIISNFSNFGSAAGNLGTGLRGAAKGTGVLSAAMKILKFAIASTGIGLLVVALGSVFLYFTKSSEGAYKLKVAMTVINTVVSVFVDKLIGMGSKIVSFFGNVGSLLKAVFTGDFAKAKDIAADIMDGFKNINIGESISSVINEIKTEAAAALRIQKALNELDRREIQTQIDNSKKKAQIAELIKKTQDYEKYTAAERLEYVKQAQRIQKEINAEAIAIEKERVKLMKEGQDLGENTIDDNKEMAAAIEQLNNVKKQGEDADRGLLRRLKKASDEYEKQNKLITTNRELYGGKTELIKPKGLENTDTDTAITIAPIDTSQLDEVQTRLVDFSAASQQIAGEINGAFEGIAVSFFETTGQLLAGTGSLESFGNMVMETMADLAIKVGKIAIGVGMSTLGIKKALESLNPALAIAAGGALIALGSFAKSSLANAANAATSSGGAIATAGNISTSTQAQEFNINGEFKIAGRDLALVLNKENYRMNKTT